MRLHKKVALLSLVAVAHLYAQMSTVESLIIQMNQTTDDATKAQLMRQVDQELAKMSNEDRSKAIALIKTSDKETKETMKEK